MADRLGRYGILSVLLLSRSRALVSGRRFRVLVAVIASVYAFIALLAGSMLVLSFSPQHVTPYVAILPWGYGPLWWNYPGLLAVFPNFILALPFLPTIFMLLTSAGVGLGMSVAVVVGAGLLRQRRAAAGGPAAMSGVVGLTPAMIALVTLGACCSTTAAATAGIGIAAGATGTDGITLLYNTWYLGLFQLVVMYVALLAQEQLVRVYSSLFPRVRSELDPTYMPPPISRRFLAGAALRVVLLVSGLTWSLTMLGEWVTLGPVAATTGMWFAWLLQNLLIGLLAVLAALAPAGLLRAAKQDLFSQAGLGLRILLAVAGLSLAVGVPPPIATTGWHGLVNELLGSAGVSSAWGGVAPSLPVGLGLGLRWGFQYLFLGSFALAVAVRPEPAFRPLLWAVSRVSTPPRTPVSVPPGDVIPISEGRLPVSSGADR
ncbi:MAG: hypothetical protein L3K14_00575 [Thermoplasmata archaeon]|nr:hypothetical protein [Thermoplasmata archaeon]